MRRGHPHSAGAMACRARLGYRDRDLPHSGKALPMPRRLLAAAAAGALLLGLAACDDGEEGAVTTAPPSVSVSAPSDGGGEPAPSDGGGTGTDDPTAAAPHIPPPDPADYAGMDEKSETGAVQAFRHYVATAMWAHQTGEDSQLASLQTETCEGCSDFNAEIPALKKQGKYWGEFEVIDVQVTPMNPRTTITRSATRSLSLSTRGRMHPRANRFNKAASNILRSAE
ncbi:DUF6318 family protein [Brachybacterium sp. UNK5269]|uniref:DUF6318 family protein n=1 Tax=Brachybacterium sp. UNK5269 TaxID=3408576 RepID=UPI003BAFEBB7